ncbi:hypothetical protein [Sedimentitalea nanhaiensis]|uniref:Secreted protein n=1 Tax=Sedimentitalea nanhaiensis TaxID=999627 RepID=A0A1I6X563_9RHOB|nr:hypothetical protein [Sedimentitalea nanhaiensis]SFT33296.1 hypothetical protein SAMN05216236_10154 [Sedimentitalea nanhaiensis]
MRGHFMALALCLAGPLAAQDWAVRGGDIRLSAQDLRDLADGATLTYHDGGVSKFSAGGAYSYTYANGGGSAFGVFHIAEDGRVCINYRNGFSRCDIYVRKNGVLLMLSEAGERFPVRLTLGLEP